MRKLLLLITIVTPCFAWAQPVLTKAFEMDSAKPSYTQTRSITTSSVLWKTGANVVWNFPPPIDNTYKTTYTTLKKIDAFGQNDSFTQATHYVSSIDSVGTRNFSYYFSNNDSFCYLGYYTDAPDYTLMAHWFDPEVSLKYPLTYNDSFEDEAYFYFTGRNKDLSDSSTSYAWVQTKTVADGYGKVLIGATEIDSVLRVRVTSTRINKSYFSWDKNLFKHDTSTDISLYWLSSKYNQPVAALSVPSYGVNNKFVYISYIANINLFAQAPQKLNAVLKVYPNPATNRLFVDAETPWEQLYITDITGRTMAIYTEYTNQLPVEQFTEGIYFITATDKHGNTSTAKFIKD